MMLKQVVRLQGGQISLSTEVLQALGISAGDSVVLYQMGDEIQMRRHEIEKDQTASGL
ncbi:MAG: AbrB/MazE/SpoVT family DNA-binding domain-containing protein [Firmicutes bacterium]|nr:AbrB/MazE/SpoVT family DNA-binding domain-containing protein [Bacillota bacterium]MCL5064505.1 AbrB/MazE/SpoVT family DNA-binding domain-containing protein [Bacillota bacterium]